MDPSGLIFLALAVAWAVYLIPLAKRHHDATRQHQPVETFSQRLRVLARREPTSAREARLVVPSATVTSESVAPTGTPTAATLKERVAARAAATRQQQSPQRPSARAAARRRRNVLSVILLALVVVAGLSLSGLFSSGYTAIPAGVLVAWLVACRLMVKSERKARRSVTTAQFTQSAAESTQTGMNAVIADDPKDQTGPIEQVANDPSRWDMIPVQLPTYVTKSSAPQRTVESIDLESTGVWTSGRTVSDAALARQADDERAAQKQAVADEPKRAAGA